MTVQQEKTTGLVPAFHVGHRMQLALEVAGISKGEMADYLGVSRATTLRWMNLTTPVKRHVLVAWAMRTGVDVDWLETGVVRHEGLEPPTR